MRDAAVAARALPGPADASGHLARATGHLAGRLADLVGSLAADAEPTLVEAETFLRGMARATEPPETLDETLPVGRVARALGLAPLELDLLFLAGLPEEHEGYASVLRRIGPSGEPRPTVGLAAQLLCAAPGERPLLRHALEQGAATRSGALVVGSPTAPFSERTLRLGEGLWSALHGIEAWPASARRIEGAISLGGLDEWLESRPAARAAAALAEGAAVTVLVTAETEAIALDRAAALALHARVPFTRLALAEDAPEELVALLGVHALAHGCVPVLRLAAVEAPGTARVPELGDHSGPVVVCGRAGATVARGARPLVPVPADPLAPSARRRMWLAALPRLADAAPLLAVRHAVEPVAAAETAADVAAIEAVEGRVAALDDVLASVRSRAGLSLSAGVRLQRPTASWDQLVLRPDRLAQLREALDRLVHQAVVLDDWGFLAGRPGARGVRMLFAGPPGTGKTFSAEVLAHELGVDLLLVDIARVVSKWIGETEKNLAEVFDAAERAQAVLFFDEADALFGRRTEVSDAHDRYANLETAYLLARLERFEGLAILATNLRQNVDPAFTRRLEFVVEFEEPSAVEREELWRRHLPEGAPVADDVDLRDLAVLYPVVGGLIRNAAVAGGFLAAAEGAPIARRHLVQAVRREYEKAGRAFPGPPAEPVPREET
jgi:hypothetical protein